MGRYQNSGEGTGTLDIKVLSQVGHPMLPADTLVQFDDVEDMLLGRGVFDGMGVVKRHNKKVCKEWSFIQYVGKTCVQWVGQEWDIDIKI